LRDMSNFWGVSWKGRKENGKREGRGEKGTLKAKRLNTGKLTLSLRLKRIIQLQNAYERGGG